MQPLSKRRGFLSNLLTTIRGRLALIYTGAIVVALAISGTLAYQTLERKLIERVDNDLTTEVREFRDIMLQSRSGDPHGAARKFLDIEQFSYRDILVFVVTKDGKVTSNISTDKFGPDTGAMFRPTIDLDALEAENRRLRINHRVRVHIGAGSKGLTRPDEPVRRIADLATVRLEAPWGTVRFLDDPIIDSGKQIGSFRIAMRLEGLQNTLDYMGLATALGALAALLVAVIFSYLLTGRALHPIRKITAAARTINKEDLSQRIDAKVNDSELEELIHTFNRMLDRLERAFLEQDRFLSDASHELRTPLTIIRGNLELMLRNQDKNLSPMNEDAVESVALVLDETSRLTRLIDSLLLLARSTGSDFISANQFNLRSFLDEMLRKASNLGERRWVLEAGAETDVLVWADRDRFTQVFLNLLQNAYDQTEESDEIRLGAKSGDQGFSLWVADSGAGIPFPELDRVFRRFYRVDLSRSRQTGGTGLGLAIAEAIVRAHGGDITVTSLSGSGSTFFIWLPQQDSLH